MYIIDIEIKNTLIIQIINKRYSNFNQKQMKHISKFKLNIDQIINNSSIQIQTKHRLKYKKSMNIQIKHR